jgi:hypothetical protein
VVAGDELLLGLGQVERGAARLGDPPKKKMSSPMNCGTA